MNNPLSADPRHALAPYPVNSTGWRLYQMLSARTGAGRRDYLGAFERRNLLWSQTWDRAAARRAAEEFRELVEPELAGRTVVVLGAEPRDLLGLPQLLVHPQRLRGVTWRQLPHPSGRCHWYNDPGNRAVAELLLEELYEEARR